MRDTEFEQKFLEFVYETDQVITAGAVAYHCKVPIEEADGHLQRLAGRGVVTLESDEVGNLYYDYPNRPQGKKLAPKQLASGTAGGRLMTTPQHIIQVGGQPGSGEILQPVVRADGTATCPACAEEIQPQARKCKHCGEAFDPALRRHSTQPVQVNVGVQPYQAPHPPTYTGQYHPAVAALLSFVWPGAGQLYCGRVGAGLAWMMGTMFGYLCFFFPGLITHIVCVLNAAKTARET